MQVRLLYSAVDGWVIAGSIAAIIATLVAVIGLVHQIRSSRRDHQRPIAKAPAIEAAPSPVESGLELKLAWMWPTYDNGTIGPDSIGLTLVNRLDHPVTWTSAGINLQDGSGRHLALIDAAPPGMGLPQRVESHDSKFTMVAAQQLRDEGFDLSRSMTARASVATGETVVSAPWTPGH
jgi:hypothetical protein